MPAEAKTTARARQPRSTVPRENPNGTTADVLRSPVANLRQEHILLLQETAREHSGGSDAVEIQRRMVYVSGPPVLGQITPLPGLRLDDRTSPVHALDGREGTTH